MSTVMRISGPYIINNHTLSLRSLEQQNITPSIRVRMPKAITRRTLTRDPFLRPSDISASAGFELRPPTY